MNAVVENNVTHTTTVVESEELGLVTVLASMFFHAGQRLEEELENQNPESPTTKVYVSLKDHGLFVANAVEDSTAIGGIVLTHLQPLESVKGFMSQINREVDRTKEGEAFLLSARA